MAKNPKMSCRFETEDSVYAIRLDRDNIYRVYRVERGHEVELGGFKVDDTIASDETLIDAAELVIAESA